jgi:hypothetical protein
MSDHVEVGIPHSQQNPDLAHASPKFPLGQCVATPGALVALAFNGFEPYQFLARHVCGDYGDLSEEDKRLNDEAIETGGRILSAYILAGGEKIWVISEADRSSTCLLLPSDY